MNYKALISNDNAVIKANTVDAVINSFEALQASQRRAAIRAMVAPSLAYFKSQVAAEAAAYEATFATDEEFFASLFEA